LSKAIEEDLGHGLSEATIHETLKILAHAKCERYIHRYVRDIRLRDPLRVVKRKGIPKPNMAAIQTDQTMPRGTAVAAFDASSEICTAESNEPMT
jgi:hypothetical protein